MRTLLSAVLVLGLIAGYTMLHLQHQAVHERDLAVAARAQALEARVGALQAEEAALVRKNEQHLSLRESHSKWFDEQRRDIEADRSKVWKREQEVTFTKNGLDYRSNELKRWQAELTEREQSGQIGMLRRMIAKEAARQPVVQLAAIARHAYTMQVLIQQMSTLGGAAGLAR